MCFQYNDGIPPESRFATHSDIFKDTVKNLNEEEGLEKINKVKELSKLAETGTSFVRWFSIKREAPAELGCNVTHLALAWVARNPNTSTIILGASKPEQVLDNLKALEIIPKLTPEILNKIEEILKNKPAPNVCHQLSSLYYAAKGS